MAFGASGGRRAVLSTMANGPTFDPHGVDHQRVAFVIADGIPKPDRASEVLQELNCGAQHKKSPSLSFSLETNHHTLLSWFFCHTSPTEGPCYRTPAVPSRSAGVSIFCRGRLALARTQPQSTPRTYFGLSFPAAVAPTIPMTVPRAITSAPVVPVTVPAPLRLSAGADIRRSRRSCRRSRRSRPGSSPAFAALEMTGVPLWSHGRAR
jgi:hypothetical protein